MEKESSSSQVLLRMARTDIKSVFEYVNVKLRNEVHRSIEQQIDNILLDFKESISDLPNRLLSDALQENGDENVLHHHLLDDEQRTLHRQSSLERIRLKLGSTNDLSTIAEVSRGRISDLQVTDQITESLMTTFTRTISLGTHTEQEPPRSPDVPIRSSTPVNEEPKVEKESHKPSKSKKSPKGPQRGVDGPPRRALRSRRKEINYKE